MAVAELGGDMDGRSGQHLLKFVRRGLLAFLSLETNRHLDPLVLCILAPSHQDKIAARPHAGLEPGIAFRISCQLCEKHSDFCLVTLS